MPVRSYTAEGFSYPIQSVTGLLIHRLLIAAVDSCLCLWGLRLALGINVRAVSKRKCEPGLFVRYVVPLVFRGPQSTFVWGLSKFVKTGCRSWSTCQFHRSSPLLRNQPRMGLNAQTPTRWIQTQADKTKVLGLGRFEAASKSFILPVHLRFCKYWRLRTASWGLVRSANAPDTAAREVFNRREGVYCTKIDIQKTSSLLI